MHVHKPAASETVHAAVITAALITATILGGGVGAQSQAAEPATTHSMVTATPPARLSPTAALAASTQPATPAPILVPAVATAKTLPTTPVATSVTTPMSAAMATTMPAVAAVEATVPFKPAPPPTTPAELQADAALAERLSAIAQSSLPAKVQSNDLWDPLFQGIDAMLTASVKLDPRNARVARLAVDAATRTGDQKAVLDGLVAVYAASPADQFTLQRLLDLHLSQMQTSPEKLAYLKDVMGRPAQPAPLRAHAGVVAAKLLLERDEPDAASHVLGEALRQNPASIEGLRMKYQMLPPDASPFERATVLLELLRANPGQPAYTTQLADLLSSAGLSQEAIPWYQLTIALTAGVGRPDLRAAQDCAAELLLADQEPDAASLAQQLVTVDPTNTTNWFLKLAVIHGNTSNDDYQKTLQQARNVAGNALVTAVAGFSLEGNKPTTRPITAAGDYPLPDLSAAVDRLNGNQSIGAQNEMRSKFVPAAADYATLELLYAQDANAAAAPIAALAKLLPASNPTLQRLQGWSALLGGDHAAALQQLSAAAESDPLAALGLIKLEMAPPATSQPSDAAPAAQAASPGKARSAAVRLLSAHPGQLMGAILFDQLRDTGARAVLSAQATSLQATVDPFPMNWLNVLDQPQNFLRDAD